MDEYKIEVNGKKINFKQAGTGQIVVLLHGVPCHLGLWDGVISYLDKLYCVYAFDLLGYGESDRGQSSEINIKAQAMFLKDVFESMRLKNIILVGHDIGGGIAQIMALLNPEILKAIVLIDSVCYDSWPIELLKVESKVSMMFEHLPVDVLYRLFISYIEGGLYNKSRAEEIAQKYWKYIDRENGIKDFLEMVQSLNSKYTMEISHMLDKIKLPTLILWGKADIYLKLSYGYRLSEDIKNSKIEIIDGAGHFLPEDQPEKVGKLIESFINSL